MSVSASSSNSLLDSILEAPEFAAFLHSASSSSSSSATATATATAAVSAAPANSNDTPPSSSSTPPLTPPIAAGALSGMSILASAATAVTPASSSGPAATASTTATVASSSASSSSINSAGTTRKKRLSVVSNTSEKRSTRWTESFDALLADPVGVEQLMLFLQSEFSDENILFWASVQQYKLLATSGEEASLQTAARNIFEEFVAPSAQKVINISGAVRLGIEKKLDEAPVTLFDAAERTVYSLMKHDSYLRFLKSDHFAAYCKKEDAFIQKIVARFRKNSDDLGTNSFASLASLTSVGTDSSSLRGSFKGSKRGRQNSSSNSNSNSINSSVNSFADDSTSFLGDTGAARPGDVGSGSTNNLPAAAAGDRDGGSGEGDGPATSEALFFTPQTGGGTPSKSNFWGRKAEAKKLSANSLNSSSNKLDEELEIHEDDKAQPASLSAGAAAAAAAAAAASSRVSASEPEGPLSKATSKSFDRFLGSIRRFRGKASGGASASLPATPAAGKDKDAGGEVAQAKEESSVGPDAPSDAAAAVTATILAAEPASTASDASPASMSLPQLPIDAAGASPPSLEHAEHEHASPSTTRQLGKFIKRLVKPAASASTSSLHKGEHDSASGQDHDGGQDNGAPESLSPATSVEDTSAADASGKPSIRKAVIRKLSLKRGNRSAHSTSNSNSNSGGADTADGARSLSVPKHEDSLSVSSHHSHLSTSSLGDSKGSLSVSRSSLNGNDGSRQGSRSSSVSEGLNTLDGGSTGNLSKASSRSSEHVGGHSHPTAMQPPPSSIKPSILSNISAALRKTYSIKRKSHASGTSGQAKKESSEGSSVMIVVGEHPTAAAEAAAAEKPDFGDIIEQLTTGASRSGSTTSMHMVTAQLTLDEGSRGAGLAVAVRSPSPAPAAAPVWQGMSVEETQL